MINNDTPEETNDFKDLKIAGCSSVRLVELYHSKFLIAKLVNYSLALQIINTNEIGIFYCVLN
jgi:hypothetical protein